MSVMYKIVPLFLLKLVTKIAIIKQDASAKLLLK